MDNDFKPPVPTRLDRLYTMLKAGCEEFPGGSLFTAFLGLFAGPVYEVRKEEWTKRVGLAVTDLMDRDNLTLEDLQNNPAFVDAVLQASRIAVTTSQKEKIQALRNAVLNSASTPNIDTSRQQMFLTWVDDLTERHLQILAMVRNPLRWFEAHGITPKPVSISTSLSAVLTRAFPELSGQRDFLDRLWADLHQRSLVGPQSIHAMSSANGAHQSQTTSLGGEFLDFISDPLVGDSKQ